MNLLVQQFRINEHKFMMLEERMIWQNMRQVVPQSSKHISSTRYQLLLFLQWLVWWEGFGDGSKGDYSSSTTSGTT